MVLTTPHTADLETAPKARYLVRSFSQIPRQRLRSTENPIPRTSGARVSSKREEHTIDSPRTLIPPACRQRKAPRIERSLPPCPENWLALAGKYSTCCFNCRDEPSITENAGDFIAAKWEGEAKHRDYFFARPPPLPPRQSTVRKT